MGRYILRRLLIAVPTLTVIALVIYVMLATAPGNPLGALANDDRISAETRIRILQTYGLDKPPIERFFAWFTAILRLDFGDSFMSHSPVMGLILLALPNTLAVVGVAYIVGIVLAIPIGIISATKRYTAWDMGATGFAYVGFTLPTFLTGTLFLMIFTFWMHWLPYAYDSNLQVRDLASFGQQVKQSIMPIMVLGLFDTAILTRYVRAEMLEHLPLDYVRTARSKGLREQGVILGHVLRNSLIPVVTLVALGIPGVFGGAIITETIFRVPGIGQLLINSISTGDIPVAAAVLFMFSVLVVAFNLVADVLYAVLDPRIKYA